MHWTPASILGNNYSYLIVREEMQIDGSRLLILLHFNHLLLVKMFASLRHIPTDENIHSWIPFPRNGCATNVAYASLPCTHIRPSSTVHRRRIDIFFGMVNNPYTGAVFRVVSLGLC